MRLNALFPYPIPLSVSQDVLAVIERRKQECLQWVRKVREDKRTILREQLDLIQAEKEKVQRECDGLQYQVVFLRLLEGPI